MDNRLTIVFTSVDDRFAFVKMYSGDIWRHHPNYNGTFVNDRVLGDSEHHYLYLERDKIKDFKRLRDDVTIMHGMIII